MSTSVLNASHLSPQMEVQNAKSQRAGVGEGEEDHPAVKDCIKQLGPDRWLLGPFLICERDISSHAFSTFFKSKEFSLEWVPLDPKAQYSLLDAFKAEQHGGSASGTEKMGLEFAE